MNRVIAFCLSGALFASTLGALIANPPGVQAEAAPAERPAGPGAPALPPPYRLFLPLVNKRYLAGYVSPFGIDMYNGNANAEGQAQMKAAGSGWETVSFHWSNIEPNPPVSGTHTYNWAGFDPIAAHAQTAGMSLFVLFTATPTWASSSSLGPVNPAHLADLYSMAAAAAERYDGDGVNDAPGSPVVNDWSFYPEPDNQSHWGNSANAYADMLAGVAAAMHAANPQAVVMIGGLAYDYFTQQGGPFVKAFLGNVLTQLNTKPGGIAHYLDAVAFHYYPINTGVWPTIKEKTQEVRGILSAHGVGSLPLMVPEMGYWSETVSGHPEFNSTEPQQARVLVEMFVRGLAVDLKQMSWFMVFDSGSGTEAHGLFRGTNLNSPKPSYTAYSTLISELTGAKYAGALSGGGVEGYLFNMADATSKTVAWATHQASANVVFHQSCVRRVDYMGAVTTVNDGNATWDKDSVVGQITLQVLQDQPIYVSGC